MLSYKKIDLYRDFAAGVYQYVSEAPSPPGFLFGIYYFFHLVPGSPGATAKSGHTQPVALSLLLYAEAYRKIRLIESNVKCLKKGNFQGIL
jgi:hypothetical protein